MSTRAHESCRSARRLGAALAAALVCSTAHAAVPARMTHAYDLASMTGKIATTGATLVFDPRHDELLVLESGIVRVFSAVGMEIFSFGDDEELHGIVSVAPFGEGGDYLVLTKDGELVRCDYRGALAERIHLGGLPPELAQFRPYVVGYAEGRMYLGDPANRVIVVADADGAYVKHLDLGEVIGRAEDNGEPLEKGYLEVEVRGLQFDARGHAVFTVPTLFRAFVVAPDGTSRAFGKKGGGPGSFNVVVAITIDAEGNLFVADVLRCSISVFSPELQFVTQFGGRGSRPGRLVGPSSIVAGNGKIYVSQGVKRGVSVFKPVTG